MSARLLKDPATASSRIFVGHLQTDDTTKLELEEHFAKYGNIVGSVLNRGFAFVQFEDEQCAQNAIKNEDGAMFKGRRIDVRPAKKDSGGGNRNAGMNNAGNNGPNSSFGNSGPFGKPQGSPSNPFNVGNNQFNNSNDSFKSNQSFGPGNQSFGAANQSFTPGNQNFNNPSQNFTNDNSVNNDTQFNNTEKGNDSTQMPNGDKFNDNGQSQNQESDTTDHPGNDNNQFNVSNTNKGGNSQFPGNQNRHNNSQFPQGGYQNKQTFNQNRNQGIGNASDANMTPNVGGGPGGGPGGGGNRRRGTRGGKNRNKNHENAGVNNFRDRSPIGGRGNRSMDDMSGNRDWDFNKQQSGSNNFGRDTFNDSGNRYNSASRDMNISFNNASVTSEYSSSGTEKNDCEIIVINKSLTEYAEAIELRLKKIGLTVDLLFPNDDVLLSRVLGNIASRGCLYAVVVTPVNQEHHSLTLNILHGLPQEHRNMPVDDAITLISRDFANYKSGGRSVPLNTPFANERHPDPIQVLLNMLADNHQLTVLQYDRVIKYLEVKREEQVQVELGDAKDLPGTTLTVNDPKQAELQSRILNILNSNKTTATASIPSPVPAPVPVSAPVPAPVPPATWGTAASTTAAATSTTSTSNIAPSPLLNDPTVQKALDSLLQGNLLKNIGDQQPAPSKTPLFAAFSNIGRF